MEAERKSTEYQELLDTHHLAMIDGDDGIIGIQIAKAYQDGKSMPDVVAVNIESEGSTVFFTPKEAISIARALLYVAYEIME